MILVPQECLRRSYGGGGGDGYISPTVINTTIRLSTQYTKFPTRQGNVQKFKFLTKRG